MTIPPFALALFFAIPIALVVNQLIERPDFPEPTDEEKEIDEACDRHW